MVRRRIQPGHKIGVLLVSGRGRDYVYKSLRSEYPVAFLFSMLDAMPPGSTLSLHTKV